MSREKIKNVVGFGAAIRRIRLARRWTQRKLADFLGVTEPAVRNYEKGRHGIAPLILSRLLPLAPAEVRREIESCLPVELGGSVVESAFSQKMKVSRERYEALHAALNLVFERAPSSVVNKVDELLTKYAGQEWEEK